MCKYPETGVEHYSGLKVVFIWDARRSSILHKFHMGCHSSVSTLWIQNHTKLYWKVVEITVTYIYAVIACTSLSFWVTMTRFLVHFDDQWFIHCRGAVRAALLHLCHRCVTGIWFSGAAMLQVYRGRSVILFFFYLSLWKQKMTHTLI